MNNQLQKAIKLAKKTGDRLIVFENPNSDCAFVMMSLDEYEKVSLGRSEVKGLTEEELLDKINRDIAIWKSEQDFSVQDSQPFGSFSYFSEAESASVGKEARDREESPRRNNPWAIPPERKEGAEEIVDIDEERQYLEDI